VERPPSWEFRPVVHRRLIAYGQSWTGGEQTQERATLYSDFRLHDAPVAPLQIPILHNDRIILIDPKSLGNLFRYKRFLLMYPASRFNLGTPFLFHSPR
jgi:hypothetical protein